MSPSRKGKSRRRGRSKSPKLRRRRNKKYRSYSPRKRSKSKKKFRGENLLIKHEEELDAGDTAAKQTLLKLGDSSTSVVETLMENSIAEDGSSSWVDEMDIVDGSTKKK